MFKKLDLRHRDVPKTLAWGRLRISHFDRFNMTEIIIYSESCCDGFTIKRIENGQSIAMLRVEYYQQSASNSEQYKRMYGPDGSWARSKKWIMLPEGLRFEPHMLRIKAMPDSWEHRVILHNKGCFSHHYEKDDAVLVVTFQATQLDSMLEDPLFNCVSDHLHMTDDTPDHSANGFEHKKPDHGITESPLPQAWSDEIALCVLNGMKALSLDPAHEPNFSAIYSIHQFILDLRKKHRQLSKSERQQLAVDLGCVWGQAVCNTRKWIWVMVKYPDVPEALPCIVRTDRCYAIAPMNLLNGLIATPSAERTGLLLYNMLGDINPLEDEIPNTYQMLE